MCKPSKVADILPSELEVKVVNTSDMRVRYLRDQLRPVKHVSFDHSGSLLAVACTDAVVYVYSLSSEEPQLIKRLDGLIQHLETDAEASAKALWHPDGRALAAPTALKGKRDEQVRFHSLTVCRVSGGGKKRLVPAERVQRPYSEHHSSSMVSQWCCSGYCWGGQEPHTLGNSDPESTEEVWSSIAHSTTSTDNCLDTMTSRMSSLPWSGIRLTMYSHTLTTMASSSCEKSSSLTTTSGYSILSSSLHRSTRILWARCLAILGDRSRMVRSL